MTSPNAEYSAVAERFSTQWEADRVVRRRARAAIGGASRRTSCRPLRRSGGRAPLVVVLLLAAHALVPAHLFAQVATSVPPQPERVKIPVKGAGMLGGDIEMVTEVFRSPRSGTAPVVLFSHGRATTLQARQELEVPVPRGHVTYWQRKGFAVVAPIRPGYGATGGNDREVSGSRYDEVGRCTSIPDFSVPARNAAAATNAAIVWIRAQAWADGERILLVGQSLGGLASVATAATRPPGVVAFINFSGGAGGDPERAPGRVCAPERMAVVMEDLGRTTVVPNLWLYAENDRYWGAEAPKLWHAAFAKGGSATHFVMTAPVPDQDGHRLLLRGGRLWSVHTDRFVKELGF